MFILKYYIILAAMIIKSPVDYSIDPVAQAESQAYHAVLYVEAMERAIKRRNTETK